MHNCLNSRLFVLDNAGPSKVCRGCNATCESVRWTHEEEAKCSTTYNSVKSIQFKCQPLRHLQVAANQAELQELEATEQHLKRQQASLTERLSRLENQSALKREAAASAVEEQLKEKEAIEAENAAARAKIAENEAMVSCVVPTELHMLMELVCCLLLPLVV